jgi:hypothetical protein
VPVISWMLGAAARPNAHFMHDSLELAEAEQALAQTTGDREMSLRACIVSRVVSFVRVELRCRSC